MTIDTEKRLSKALQLHSALSGSKVKLATAYFRTTYMALSLALPPFTSVFGMGTGGSTAHCCQSCAADPGGIRNAALATKLLVQFKD